MPDFDNPTTIEIKELGVTVTLYDKQPDGKWGTGAVTSTLHEDCPYCHETECDMDCFEFGEHCTDRDPDMFQEKADERHGFLAYNGAVDALESMILAHACAGGDVTAEWYVTGIQTALQALGNNLPG